MADSNTASSVGNGATPPVPERAPGPFSRFEWMIALRYLRARRREGFISVIAGFSFVGILLGVATLIIVMAVMNGFRTELMDRILGVNGHVVVRSYGQPIQDFDALTQAIANVPGVVSVTPQVDGQAMISSRGAATGAYFRGVRAADLDKTETVSSNIVEGSIEAMQTEGGVALGSRLARSLGVQAGDTITLLSPRGAATPFGTAPRVKGFPVAAVFEIGMSEYDAGVGFLPLDAAQSFFNYGNGVSAIEIMIEDPDRVSEIAPEIVRATNGCCSVQTWQETNQSFFSALQVERNVMFLILTLILLVAALNIVSGLIMLVKDKGRDIAVLRTMGTSRGSVLRIFLIAGASIGVVGTLAGFLLGVAFCANIEELRQALSALSGTELFSPEVYYLSQMPAEMDPVEVASVVVMALGLSLLATVYPAWRAASLDPVEALRYE